ncbi:hypothetical protein TNCV_5093371 [Trichonephila clavipes]|nr:hypothetical protein TNCV_5093371 [Trichonephila clavipes]
MENQRLGVAGGVIFYVTWSMVEYDIIEKALMQIAIPLYSHPETHNDPVGMALQEAYIMAQRQTQTALQPVNYMMEKGRQKRRERFPETSVFILDGEDDVTFFVIRALIGYNGREKDL